jgi:hypothetical protein
MTDLFAVVVVDGLRFWCVEGDANTAERIGRITGCETILVPVLSLDTFLRNFGKQDPLHGVSS